MQDKQKVTFYLSPELHRQLKIKSAVDATSMSDLVEEAMSFYLRHPEVVDEVEASVGHTHRVYSCPECTSAVVLKQGELVGLHSHPSILEDDLVKVPEEVKARSDSPGQEELVPC